MRKQERHPNVLFETIIVEGRHVACQSEDRLHIAKNCGFKWDPKRRHYYTTDPRVLGRLWLNDEETARWDREDELRSQRPARTYKDRAGRWKLC